MAEVRIFVEEVANIINISTEKQEEIIKQLDYESISKRWQLKSVSNEQWESMGAPDGFVTILQTCLDRHAERELEELKNTINSDVNHAIASAQPRARSKTGRRRRLSKANSMSELDLDNANKEASPVALELRRRNSVGPRRRSSNSGGSLNNSLSDLIDLIGDIGGDKESNPVAPASPVRRSRNTIGDTRRVSKSPEKRRGVIGHDVSDKELEIAGGQRSTSRGPRRRESRSVESLNDINRRVSKSPEKHRAVIGHDVSDKELDMAGKRRSSTGPRQRKSKSIEPLNDVNRRVSKSPESRRAVIGHDVSDKELDMQGQRRRRSLGPRRQKSKSIEPLNDVEIVGGDDNGRRRRMLKSAESLRSLGDIDTGNTDSNPIAGASPGRRRKLKSAGSLRSLGDIDIGNTDSNPITVASPGRQGRRHTSLGPRRFSKSPDKRRAVTGNDSSHKDLDAVERSRLNRQESRRRLQKKTASASSTLPLKGEEGNGRTNSGLRQSNRGTKADDNSVGSGCGLKNSTSDDENNVGSGRRRARGKSSNYAAFGPKTQRSLVLAPRPQSPGGPTQLDNDGTMKTRRRARTARRPSGGRLQSESQSPRRSFARCQSESPSAKRALVSELNLPAAPMFDRANSSVHLGCSAKQAAKSDIAQFQPSLEHAVQRNNRSYLPSNDSSSPQPLSMPEHSFSIEKDTNSGRFCYLSRGKILYEWNQSFDTMVLMVPKPPEVPEADVVCTIEESSLQLGRKGDRQAFFHRPLGGKCIPESSIWVPYGGADVKGIIVHLKKANPGEKWQRPLLAVTGTKVKKTERSARRDSLPEDFGSPRLHKDSITDAAHQKERRRMSMGQKSSSSRGLEILEPENINCTPRAVAKTGVDLETLQHANRVEKFSSHSVDFLLDLPDEETGSEDDEESFWGSSASLPTLGPNLTEEADEKRGKEGKKRRSRRRRIKRGSRQMILQAASSMSPGKLKFSITKRTLSTDTSDSKTNGKGLAEGPMHSSYQQLDGGDNESVFSMNDESGSSPKQQPLEGKSEPNCFTHMLVEAAPLPFDADENAIAT
ncbi:unnamed protein product [Cylindrotheca closterium]|uniref:CS domain-containing protein n=1 Tax=Cylindrotheca closterium TaxID=2856 RepID=A0AAD2JK29_9STRA|nr:unnamed protein product [Cylindrotheca closterium]